MPAPPAPARQAPVANLGRRVALVIGNSAYEHAATLRNPRNDAQALAARFRRLGFAEVIERHDLGLADLGAELKRFGDRAQGADWAVIYYAGHGLEVGGVNYLIPVDARLERVSHVEDEALTLDRLLSKVEGARRLRLVILDACRNNPFAPRMQPESGRKRSIGRGLTSIEPRSGVAVAYASRDGTIAADGDGDNSPFAEALLQHLDEPGVELRLLLGMVRDSVLERTGGAQEPYLYGSLPGQPFYFKP